MLKILDDYLIARDDAQYYNVNILLNEENKNKLEATSTVIGGGFIILFINDILKQHFKALETELSIDLLNDSDNAIIEALANRKNSLRGYEILRMLGRTH
ncbi:hypothetical protein [Priestia endophytica]|uniref:hypothetical protein n=1 Tax=Priestia endophytica TaxID=135735 RepID=UPI000F52180E|nr:hypothetical protein [Priestia endophytica]